MREKYNTTETERRESMQVSANEFIQLVAEKKPEKVFYSTHIGSFDWQTWVMFFFDGDTKVQTSFEGSAHAAPDVPQALMEMLKYAERIDY